MSINHNRIKIADLEKNQPNKILITNNSGELEFSNLDIILVNNLTSGGTTKSLTAEMGKTLQNNKVDKITGKNLLSDTEITRLGTLSNYIHPPNHPASIIAQDANYRFVTDTEKVAWNNKQSLFTGIVNRIAKSLNPNSLVSSRLFDDGNYFGVGTVNNPTKDITLGNQSDKEIGIEESNSNNEGRDLKVVSGRTVNYSSPNFTFYSNTPTDTYCIAISTSNDIYLGATYTNQGVYKQTAGQGNFISIYSSNPIYKMAIASNGDFFVIRSFGNQAPFKHSGGINGTISQMTGTTNIYHHGIAINKNGNLYVTSSDPGQIYMAISGSMNLISLNQTERKYTGICCTPSGDVYVIVANGDIYKQSNGVGNFNALGQISRNWSAITCDSIGNIYVSVAGGDIYRQSTGMGAFTALNQTSRYWNGLSCDNMNNVYATVGDGNTYVYIANSRGIDNLKGGTLKLASGQGKGIGQSRIEFLTGQKTTSGTNMQLETLRAYIDENGYMIWNSMPTYPNNIAALAGGLPIGCEYKTATGQRMIVY